MTEKQAATISQMAYLDRPPSVLTLGGLRDHYYNLWNENKEINEYSKKLKYYSASFETVRKDDYLKNLAITGYQNDNDKTGFVGYTMADDEGKGIVAFRGSEYDKNPFANENLQQWVDWAPENALSAILAETPQQNMAENFMRNEAGGYSQITTVGHSLGGRLAGQMALTDDRVTDAYTYNAPGVSDAFFDATIWADRSKIHAFNTDNDYVSMLLNPLAPITTVKGVNGIDGHNARNFTEGGFQSAFPWNAFARPAINTAIGSILHPTMEGKMANAVGGIGRLAVGLSGWGNKKEGNDMSEENNLGSSEDSMGLLTEAMTLFQEANDGLRDSVIAAWDTIKGAFDAVWGGINTFFTETIPGACATLMEQFTIFGEFMATIWAPVGEFFAAVWSGIMTFFTETIPAAVAGLQAKFAEFQEFFSGIWSAVGTFFTDCWDGIVTFATETIPTFIETVVAFISELPDKIWGFLVNIVTSIGTWISDAIAKAQEVVPGFIESVVNFFLELPDKIWEWLTSAVGKIGEWASSLISKAGEVLPGVVSSITGFFTELPGKLTDIGENLIKGIGEGMEKAIGWLKEKAVGFANMLPDWLKSALGIHSPSTVMRDEVGAMIAQGIAVGIEENSKEATDAFKSMLDQLDAQRSFDLISEDEYYTELEKYRDQYLAAGTTEWLQYTEKINAYQKQQLEAEKKALDETYSERRELSGEWIEQKSKEGEWDDVFAGLKRVREYTEAHYGEEQRLLDEALANKKLSEEEYNEKSKALAAERGDALKAIADDVAAYEKQRMAEVNQEKEAMTNKLENFGELTGTVTFKGMGKNGEDIKQMTLADQGTTIDAMKNYKAQLSGVETRLEGSKLNEEDQQKFFKIMAGMSVEEGTQFASLLNNASAEEFDKYISDWSEKQRLAAEISDTLYSDETQAAVDDIALYTGDKLGEIPEQMTEGYKDLGAVIGQSFAEGLEAGLSGQASEEPAPAQEGAQDAAAADSPVSSVIDRIRTTLEGLGATIPESFFTIGGKSAEQFGIGFEEALEQVFADAQVEIDTFSNKMVADITASAKAAAAAANRIVNNYNNSTYNNNYTITGNSNSIRDQISALDQYSTVQRLRTA